jgi:hypothetical protein
MNRDHEDDDAMDLEMPPPPNQHFRHNIHNKKVTPVFELSN